VSERDDDLVAMADAVAAVGRELGMPHPRALERLLEAWPALAGPALAAHAQVRSVRDGVCTVVVDAPAWATPARYLEDDLVRVAARVCGPGAVRALRVVVARP
jgi:predicted nucleic acid-binding Zn ribbon protein